jgi:uncharacterized protein with HEPN domain
MLEAAERVTSYTAGMDFEEFAANRMAVSAVMYEIQTIGEAARHVPSDIEARYPEVEWAAMRGMRNILVHAYDAVRLEVLWHTVEHDVPALMPRLREILALERASDADRAE